MEPKIDEATPDKAVEIVDTAPKTNSLIESATLLNALESADATVVITLESVETASLIASDMKFTSDDVAAVIASETRDIADIIVDEMVDKAVVIAVRAEAIRLETVEDIVAIASLIYLEIVVTAVLMKPETA